MEHKVIVACCGSYNPNIPRPAYKSIENNLTEQKPQKEK